MSVLTADPVVPRPPAVALARTPLVEPGDLPLYDDRGLFELVDGVLVEKKMSVYAVVVVATTHNKVNAWATSAQAGVSLPEMWFAIWPDRPRLVRRPDVAFVSAATLARQPWSDDATYKAVPDLVVEVVSPNDKSYEVLEKVDEYQAAGVPLVWVLYPPHVSVHAYRLGEPLKVFERAATLTGGDVLPGFAVPVAELFPEPRPVSEPADGEA